MSRASHLHRWAGAAILARHRAKPPSPLLDALTSDLDKKEESHVRAALHYLRFQCGGVQLVPKALGTTPLTVISVTGESAGVSASLALRVARFLDVPFDDQRLGRYQPGACPKCGHRPGYVPVYASDCADEPTVVEDEPRSVGLTLVK